MFGCLCRRRRESADEDEDASDSDEDAGIGIAPLGTSNVSEVSHVGELQKLLKKLGRKLQKCEARNAKLESELSVVKVVQQQLDDAHRLMRAILRPYHGDYKTLDFVEALKEYALLKIEVEKLRDPGVKVFKLEARNHRLESELKALRKTVENLQREREQHVKEIGSLLERNMELQDDPRALKTDTSESPGDEKGADSESTLAEDIDNLMEQFRRESTEIQSTSAELFED